MWIRAEVFTWLSQQRPTSQTPTSLPTRPQFSPSRATNDDEKFGSLSSSCAAKLGGGIECVLPKAAKAGMASVVPNIMIRKRKMSRREYIREETGGA